MPGMFHSQHRHPSQGTQVYEEVPPDQPLDDAVGRPLVHTSGIKHTTGEAVYIDDMPKYQGEIIQMIRQWNRLLQH